LETFTQKLHIRKIDETNRLLEFYVSKYPSEGSPTSRLFISEIKKIIENNKNSELLNIKKVAFVSDKTIGVDDFLSFQYNILSFDKIIEFNGNYVIKFICEVEINGENIIEKYRNETLDEKYERKQKK